MQELSNQQDRYQTVRLEKVKRGEIYYAKTKSLDGGSIQQRTRPILVISNDTGNFHSNIFLGASLTTAPKRPLPTHYNIYTEETNKRSTILCEQISTYNQNDVGDYICSLNENEMEEVEKCLMISLGIKCNIHVGWKTLDRYSKELEKQLSEHNFIYDKEGYLTKIMKVPVIVKSSIYELLQEISTNNDESKVHELEVENSKLKAEVEIYKSMLDRFMGTYMQK